MYNTGNSSKNVTTTSIVDGTISNADVDASAAIAQSKLATLAITDSEVANDALSGDKIDGGTISDFASTGIDDNANANAITIDVNERVVIGGSDSSVTPNASADDLMVESSGATGITIAAGTGSTARLAFADSGDSLIGRITYDNVSNDMSFGTGGVDDRVIIQSTGGISFNGDTASANALSDFETGSWTPELRGTTGSEGTSNTTVYGATYTKIGNMVNLECYLRWDDQGSWTGDVELYGLPYAHEANTRSVGVLGAIKYVESPDSLPICPNIIAGNSHIVFSRQISDLTMADYALVSYFDNALNAFSIGITYRV